MRPLVFLVLLTLPVAFSAGALAEPSLELAAKSDSQCLRELSGCKALCFGKKARLRGHCFAACQSRYNECAG
ncbi:MAG: hypothetical protein ACPW61_10135 [Methyloligella sp. ZOD6]